MTIGEKLCKLRKQKGLSQEAVADAVGVSRQAVSKWERDESLPDLDNVKILCVTQTPLLPFLLRNFLKELIAANVENGFFFFFAPAF